MAGFEDEAGAAGGAEFFDGGGADAGDVDAEVAVGVGDFDEGPGAAFAELAGAVDHAVGAFDGFDGDDVFVDDGEGLADVGGGDHFAQGEAEVGVEGLGGGGLAAGHDAGGGHVVFGVGGGIDQVDTLGGEFIGYGVEHGEVAFVVAEAGEVDADGTEVGEISKPAGAGVHLALADAADHDGFTDAGGTEDADPLAELERADFAELVDLGDEGGLGVAAEGDTDDAAALGAGPACDEEGEDALPGDEAQGGQGRRRRRCRRSHARA